MKSRHFSRASQQRLQHRTEQESPVKLGHRSFDVRCPGCNAPMIRRIAKISGNHFWGCSNFPDCRFTRHITSSV